LAPNKQGCSNVGGVESLISIQVTQNARIDDPEKLNLRDSAVLNQSRKRALPEEPASDPAVSNEVESRNGHG
jgi:hypothetical protein